MKVIVEIDTANAAFRDDAGSEKDLMSEYHWGAEVARILRVLAERVESEGRLTFNDPIGLWDYNGHRVGVARTV